MAYFILSHQGAKVGGGSALKVTGALAVLSTSFAGSEDGEGMDVPAGTFPSSSTWDSRRFLQNIKSILNSLLMWNYSQPVLYRFLSVSCNHRSCPFPEDLKATGPKSLHAPSNL